MPSRRPFIELNDQEIDEYLATSQTLIVVSNGSNGYPHPLPMWFCVDEKRNCYCTTFAKSQKVVNWRRDPRAALLIESGKTYTSLKGLMIYATAEIIEDLEEVVSVVQRINAKVNPLSEDPTDQSLETILKSVSKRVVLKFQPQRFVSWDHSKLQGGY